MPIWPVVTGIGRGIGGMTRSGAGLAKSYMGTSVHQAGKKMAMEMYGVGSKLGWFGKAFGIGFTGYEAYRGYQEGGMWGAAKNVAMYGAMNYAFGAGLKMLGVGATAAMQIGLPLAAAAGVGAYAFRHQLARPYIREHMRKHAKLEMGRPIIDQFGTVATMRQRSLAAIQRSKINGRSALSNEAALTYRPYFR